MAVRNGLGTCSLVIRCAGWIFKDDHNLIIFDDWYTLFQEILSNFLLGTRKGLFRE